MIGNTVATSYECGAGIASDTFPTLVSAAVAVLLAPYSSARRAASPGRTGTIEARDPASGYARL